MVPAWALDLWVRADPYIQKLAVWRGYERELQTLAIYGIGIAVYTALVFTFYQSLSRRKPIHFHLSDRKGWRGVIGRFTERVLVFPVASFLYFSVLAVALFVLAKSQTVEQILLLSMAVIVGVRVTVHLSEKMSNDLAKLVPLSLLAVVLVDPGYLTLEIAWGRLVAATHLWPLLGRYFLLFIALEAATGTLRWAFTRLHKGSKRMGFGDPTAAFTRIAVKDNADPPPTAPVPPAAAAPQASPASKEPPK